MTGEKEYVSELPERLFVTIEDQETPLDILTGGYEACFPGEVFFMVLIKQLDKEHLVTRFFRPQSLINPEYWPHLTRQFREAGYPGAPVKVIFNEGGVIKFQFITVPSETMTVDYKGTSGTIIMDAN
jgi:hypothetical protein